MLDQPLLDQIERTGQGHLLQFWSELSVEAQGRFAKQLADIDWDLISGYRQDAGEESLGGDFNVRDAIPPTHVVRIPVTATEQIEVSVSDDGCGATAGAMQGGHGLRGMRERVALLGGELSIETAAGAGFCVRAVLPGPAPAGGLP